MRPRVAFNDPLKPFAVVLNRLSGLKMQVLFDAQPYGFRPATTRPRWHDFGDKLRGLSPYLGQRTLNHGANGVEVPRIARKTLLIDEQSRGAGHLGRHF